MAKEKVDRDIDSSLAEYLAITQVDELALNLKDLKKNPGRQSCLVHYAIFNQFLDKKDADRQALLAYATSPWE